MDTDKLIEGIFRKSDVVIAIETSTETEYLHQTEPARISLSMDGGVVVSHDVPATYATSTVVSEGAIASRKVTAVERTYKQSDVVKMLLRSLVTEAERIGEARAWKEAEGCVPLYGIHGGIVGEKTYARGFALGRNAGNRECSDATLAAMKARQEQPSKTTPAPTDRCRWCGMMHAEHDLSRDPGAPIPKVPCGLLVSKFLPMKARQET